MSRAGTGLLEDKTLVVGFVGALLTVWGVANYNFAVTRTITAATLSAVIIKQLVAARIRAITLVMQQPADLQSA